MKLFVSDIDGTLYQKVDGNSDVCTQRNLDAIKTWREANHHFAVATARIHLSYDSMVEKLGFPLDFLGGNGAEIIFSNQEKILHTIPLHFFLELVDWIEQQNIDATVKINWKGQWICSNRDHYPFYTLNRQRGSLRQAKTLKEIQVDETDVGINMSIILAPQFFQEVKEALNKKYVGILDIVGSDFDNLDCLPDQCSKKEAILLLLKRLHLSTDDLIVIGDSENDVAMFSLTTNSYCMATAEEAVKQKATYVVSDVAEAIERELAKLMLLNNE